MAMSRGRLVAVISNIVLLTLLVAFAITSGVLWAVGDWTAYAWGLGLTLRIIWGVWLLLFAAYVLTRVTMFGWRFRRVRPSEWPAATRRAFAEGVRPPSWFKTGATSFTITVVLVSLFGAVVAASVVIWIVGDWRDHREPLVLALKIIWGVWWVLVIVTVLVRIAIFARERRKAKQERATRQARTAPPAEGAGPHTGRVSQGEGSTSRQPGQGETA